MNKILIICDIFTKDFLENKLFNESYISNFPGSAFWPIVHDFCLQRNWVLITSDIFLSQEQEYHQYKKYIISEMYTPTTDILIEKGAIPLILFSQESPNVALHFHKNIYAYTSKYKHSILFGGLKEYVHPSTVFHTLYWPNNLKNKVNTSSGNWSDKELLVMVASNKRRFDVALDRPFVFWRRLIKKTYVSYIKATNSLFRFEDLYEKRIKAILHFSNVKGFALFGTLWNEENGLNRKYFEAVKKLDPVKIDDKHATLAKYKFNLCFENCVFPGYVTEKIFDCLLAGTIPVYFGAPDVEKYLPNGCFLNYQDYNSFSTLQKALEGMTAEKANSYLESGKQFLQSNEFNKFTITHFAKLINDILEQEIRLQVRNI